MFSCYRTKLFIHIQWNLHFLENVLKTDLLFRIYEIFSIYMRNRKILKKNKQYFIFIKKYFWSPFFRKMLIHIKESKINFGEQPVALSLKPVKFDSVFLSYLESSLAFTKCRTNDKLECLRPLIFILKFTGTKIAIKKNNNIFITSRYTVNFLLLIVSF